MVKNLLRRGLLALALVFTAAPAFAVVTYSTALKNARLDAITTAIGTGGKMKFICADGTTVGATLTFTGAAASAASGGVLTFNTPPAGTSSAACTFTTFKFTTSADADVVGGFSVGSTGSGANFVFNSNVFSLGQNVTVTGWSFTHP